MLHEHEHEQAQHFLQEVGQPALATRAFDYHSGSAWAGEHTMLIVDYNHASLDISLATTQRDLPDVLAHTSWPLLGEDFPTLKYASLSFEHPIRRTQQGALHDRALRIRKQHDRSSDSQIMSANESSAIESGHVEAITHKLVSMINEQTYAGAATRVSINWKPQQGGLSHILISGDASEQGFVSLRKAIASNARLVKLTDPRRGVGTSMAGWISAEGAAKDAKGRQIEEGDGSLNWIVRQKL